MFAAFGIDGFPADTPRDDAVRRLLETELPPEPEVEPRAQPKPARRGRTRDDEHDPHRYVPQHAEAASTPKRHVYDDRTRHSPFVALGGTPRAILPREEHIEPRKEFTETRETLGDDFQDFERGRSLSPRRSLSPIVAVDMSHLEREYETVAGQLAEYNKHAEANRLRRATSADPSATSALERYASRTQRSLSAASTSGGSPCRARPAWGGGGGSFKRMEDSESPVRRRHGQLGPGLVSKLVDTTLSEKDKRRVEENRARAELAAVERLRSARELREKQTVVQGRHVPNARRFSHATATAFGSHAPSTLESMSRDFRDSYDSFSGGTNAGDRLYRRGVFDREKRERERARELERLAAEAVDEVSYSREFSSGMGGFESGRSFGMTNVSRALMTDSRTFESRQRLFEHKKAESVELEKLRALRRDLEETAGLHKPSINKASASMKRSVKDLGAWQKRKEEKLEELKRDKERAETAELTFIPAIDPRSDSIATGTSPRSSSSQSFVQRSLVSQRRAKGAWSPPPSPPHSKKRPVATRTRGTSSRLELTKGKQDVVFHASVPQPVVVVPPTPQTPPSPTSHQPVPSQPESPYSPRAHEREMARALAGAALAGAAAMARVSTPGLGSTASTSVMAQHSLPAPPSPFGLTQVTHSHVHDTSPPGHRTSSAKKKSSKDEATPPYYDANAFSIRNSVAQVSRRDLSPRGPIPVQMTRAVELRNAAKRAELEQAKEKETYQPQITRKAQQLKRPGDIGERLYSGKKAERKAEASKNVHTSSRPTSSPPVMRLSVHDVLERKKQADREQKATQSAMGTSTSSAWGAYGGWGDYGVEANADATPDVSGAVARKLDMRKSTGKPKGRSSEGPPDRGARRSVQEQEARAREAWGYYE